MKKWLALPGAVVLSLAVWGCFGLTRHAIELMDAWKAAAPTQAIANLTAATAQWQAASKAQADSVTAIERDVRAEMWHVDRSLTELDSAIGTAQTTISTIQTQATRVGPLLDAAKSTVEAAQPVVRSLGASSDALTAAIQNANGGITDARTFYAANQQNIAAMLSQTVTLETTGNHMLATADAVETKATNSYLHPSHNPFKRAWQVSEPFAVAGAKITAALLP